MNPFETASNWTPPLGRNNNLDSYILKIENELDVLVHNLNTLTVKLHDNLSSNQRKALHDLKGNNNIVIKPAGKGGSTVITDKDNYMKETCTQLHDGRFYQKIDNDPTPTITNKLKNSSSKNYNAICKMMFETYSLQSSSRNIPHYPKSP